MESGFYLIVTPYHNLEVGEYNKDRNIWMLAGSETDFKPEDIILYNDSNLLDLPPDFKHIIEKHQKWKENNS